jgi:hypothetical protein
VRRVGSRGESAESRSRLALAASAAIHVAVIAGLGLSSLPVPPEPTAPPTLVATLLPNLPIHVPEAVARAPSEPSLPPVPDEPPVPDAVAGEGRAAGENVPPAPAPRPAEPEPAPPPEAESASETGGEAEAERESDAEEPPAVQRDIDWELERRRAVAMLVDQAQRDQSYRSFSLVDGDEEIGQSEPGPETDIFDAGSRGGGRSVAQVGRQRTELARRLVKLCNELSGGGIGISLFGLFGASVCAQPGPRADFFGDLRPDYLESLPLCTEVAGSGSADALAGADDAEPRVFCRLVPADDPARRLLENSPTTAP